MEVEETEVTGNERSDADLNENDTTKSDEKEKENISQAIDNGDEIANHQVSGTTGNAVSQTNQEPSLEKVNPPAENNNISYLITAEKLFPPVNDFRPTIREDLDYRNHDCKARRPKYHCAKDSVLTILLTALLALYITAGGFLFSHLEGNRQNVFNNRVEKWKNDTAILLATELRQVSPYEEIWARKVFQYLDMYEKDLLKARALGYKRKDETERNEDWSLKSSVCLSIRLITTVGLTSQPRFSWSREIIMAYSIIGILLTTVWLIYTGSTIGAFWIWMFNRFCCQLCWVDISSRVHPQTATNSFNQINTSVRAESFKIHKTVINKNLQATVKAEQAMIILFLAILIVVYFIFGATAITITEEWTIADGFYYNFLMFTTIGDDDSTLNDGGSTKYVQQNIFYFAYLLIGYSLISAFVVVINFYCTKKCCR